MRIKLVSQKLVILLLLFTLSLTIPMSVNAAEISETDNTSNNFAVPYMTNLKTDMGRFTDVYRASFNIPSGLKEVKLMLAMNDVDASTDTINIVIYKGSNQMVGKYTVNSGTKRYTFYPATSGTYTLQLQGTGTYSYSYAIYYM